MRIYLGIKYYRDNKNRELIERLTRHLESQGHVVFCVARDLEDWGHKSLEPTLLMKKTFEFIDSTDLVLIELTEKGVGLGIEAGYAFSRGIPVITVAENGADISTTLAGISKSVIKYENIDQIELT